MKLSATDCLERGWNNLLANWALIVVVGVQTLVLLFMLGICVGVPLAALGLSLDFKSMSPDTIGAKLLEGLSNPANLALGCIGVLVFLTLASVVVAYFQAGLYGILYAGETQAPLGPGPRIASFRVFSIGRFFAAAKGSFSRFFGFYALAGLLGIGALLVVVLWLGLLGVASESWGAGAAVAVGCIGALPVVFLVLVLSLVLALAKADLIRPESGPWRAIRLGLDVLARRPGAVLLFVVAFIVGGIGLAVVFVPLSMGVSFGLRSSLIALGSAHFALWLLQTTATVAFQIFQSAAFTALMQSEVAPRFPEYLTDVFSGSAPELPASEVPTE